MPKDKKITGSETKGIIQKPRIREQRESTYKGANYFLVQVKAEETSVSDDDLPLQLLQVERQAARAKKLPFGTIPSKNNRPVTNSNKGIISKPHYDPISAQNVRRELHSRTRAKHASKEEAMCYGY
jgi:hypothetical protein